MCLASLAAEPMQIANQPAPFEMNHPIAAVGDRQQLADMRLPKIVQIRMLRHDRLQDAHLNLSDG